MNVDDVRADIARCDLLDPDGDKEWGWYLDHVPVLLAEIDRLTNAQATADEPPAPLYLTLRHAKKPPPSRS